MRPSGRRKTAEDKRNENATQLSIIALRSKSRPIAGSATVMEELMNGARSDVSVRTKRIRFWSDVNDMRADDATAIREA